ncbi:MAG: hypothetical protein A4S09_08555 [Proteobacteria bacterium SG_bin7]|nr:MAG: hypothetical protein A4S09_08555 [Proteobacteria bacterium SG_bin7]
MKKIFSILIFGSFLSSSALAGWRLADCRIIPKVGGGFEIIGINQQTKNIEAEPFGPYRTLEEAEKTLLKYIEITHCVDSKK